jgi:zona occludens toxin (predicted ATPase)|tara:strand:- start:323 stop:541 length:219 start_codon:yes stop_codon:yes gene_type:complete
MAKNKNIWKFNEDDWKVHIKDAELLDKLIDKFGLERPTIYYENGGTSEETSWDVVVPDNLIIKVKKFIRNTV